LQEVNSKVHSCDKIDFGAFDNSEFLNMVTKESLRLFNPFIVASPRKLYKNIKLGEYNLKKGLNISCPILSIHRNEKFHKDCMEFKTDRHTPENARKQIRMTNVPFFTGKRNCIGQYMGEMMVKVMISSLVRHFEWKRDPDYSPRMI
jgi:cytochrome P450